MKQTISVPASAQATLVELDMPLTFKLTAGTTPAPVNKPPVVNAGTDTVITLPVSEAALAGTASDSDGTIASSVWTKVSGPAAGSILNAVALNTKVTGLVQGTYVFNLKAIDNSGAATSDTKIITVNPAVVSPVGGYLTLPEGLPQALTGSTGIVIEGKRFQDGPGKVLNLQGCANVIIRNCFFNRSVEEAISLYKCTNVLIEKCLFAYNTCGVYANASTGVKVLNNQFINMRQHVNELGQHSRGQHVQFNGVYGPGNEIIGNRGENWLGESNPEDLISMFNSRGTSASPIQIRNNWLRGGGPSASGGGIVLGDHTGDWVIADGNVLLNPGQYGMAIAGGSNQTITNNKIFAKSQPFTNNPLFIWQQTGSTVCANNVIKSNRATWVDKNGNLNGGWNAGNCTGTVFEYPTPITEAELGMPVHLISFITEAELLKVRAKTS